MIRPRAHSPSHPVPEIDRLWLMRAWVQGWMEPPSWAQAMIVLPLSQWEGVSGGAGHDKQGSRCFTWYVGRHWVWYRWRLRDGRWLHGRLPRSPFVPGGPTFAVTRVEKPEGRLKAYPLNGFPVELLRRPELQKGPAGPQGNNPKGPAGPVQQLQLQL